MTYVEVEDDVRLFVQDVGRGFPIVLLAGFGMDHRVWDRQVRVLTERGFRTICIDQRGHGRSDKPADGYGVGRLANDVAAVVAHLDIRRCALIGWSFGGQVAFAYATRSPATVERLVLIGSNAVRASRSDDFPFGLPSEVTEPALKAAEVDDRLRARRDTIVSGFAAPPREDILQWLVDCSLAMPSWTALACIESMLRTDLSQALPLATMPVLQLIGDADPVHSAKGAMWLRDRLPDSTLVELGECGHYPMFEAADAFDAALIEFLTERS